LYYLEQRDRFFKGFSTLPYFDESFPAIVCAQGTNSTQSLLEDSQALLLVKAAITKDPYNVTTGNVKGRGKCSMPADGWVSRARREE
jgi:hypothetical protein